MVLNSQGDSLSRRKSEFFSKTSQKFYFSVPFISFKFCSFSLFFQVPSMSTFLESKYRSGEDYSRSIENERRAIVNYNRGIASDLRAIENERRAIEYERSNRRAGWENNISASERVISAMEKHMSAMEKQISKSELQIENLTRLRDALDYRFHAVSSRPSPPFRTCPPSPPHLSSLPSLTFPIKPTRCTKEGQECSIACEKISVGQVCYVLKCGHMFSEEIVTWWKTKQQAKCPLCRGPIK